MGCYTGFEFMLESYYTIESILFNLGNGDKFLSIPVIYGIWY